MRRTLRGLMITLLLGAVTALAVAWACGWLGLPKPAHTTATSITLFDPFSRLPRGTMSVRRVKGDVMHVFAVETTFSPNADEFRSFHQALSGDDEHDRQRAMDAIRSDIGLHAWYAQGWPWPCTSCEYSDARGSTGGFRINRSIKVHPPGRIGPIPRALAWRPLWPGAAYNTAIYACAWWMLLFLPPMLRRMHRRSRGRCIACGYDLRGSADPRCSECGAMQEHREALPTEAPRE